jgi:uncharacterized protein (UPF0216 family)
MSEETDELEVETTEENPTVTEQDKTEKRFSQEELNKLVTQRVKREKDTARKLKEDFETQLSEQAALVTEYETVLKKMIESQSKDLPENYKKLLSKLTVLEQLEFLADETNKVSKKVIPSTPRIDEDKVEQPKKKTVKFM